MASSTTNISIRMDTELKAQAEALFGELGMNLSTAFNIFVRQSLREGGIPFDISLGKPNEETKAALREGEFPYDISAYKPNKETIAALQESERIAHDPTVKGYTDVEELLADLKK
jgi:DNA-damage-inducible protein J